MKKIISYFSLILFFLGFLGFCALHKLEKNLDPGSKEFYSEVRYLITRQERKIFLNLPSSDRDAFIKEFWRKRDPDLGTEENEFKEEYFERIEMANLLFKSGGTPGWLQDRGRVYILLGPPMERYPYPRGRQFYGLPEEIWYYGFFPIVFVDEDWDGDYKLTPLGARHIAEINRAQMAWKPKIAKKDIVFDFDQKIQKTDEGEVIFRILIPYEGIWFEEKEGIWETTLAVSLQIFDSSGNRVWEKKDDYPISFAEENLEEVLGEDYVMQFSTSLESGEYSITIELENKEDQNRISRTIKFTV
jgi:GWxTD domain-containing protein